MYNLSNVVYPAISGAIVDFTDPGQSSGTTLDLVNNTIQVLTAGVYSITMDLVTSVQAIQDDSGNVQFQLFINGVIPVVESTIRSDLFLIGAAEGFSVLQTNTIGKTIQIRLNANDLLSIHIVFVNGAVFYRYPSFTVIKITE
ncbi:hypothetical protein [Bacillus wiedmannii]|nr:hypothetical protein [Bacillus wiedmannii]